MLLPLPTLDSTPASAEDSVQNCTPPITFPNARPIHQLLSAFLSRPDVSSILLNHPTHHLGSWHYRTTVATLFPPLDLALNCTLCVLVPIAFVSWNNPKVHQCALWGTEIYTDDSDIVCMLIHTGRVQLPDPLKKRSQPLRDNGKVSAHLAVTLRVLPRLETYHSVLSHGLRSRNWNSSHDGVSLAIESVIKIGSSSYRSATRKNRKQHLQDRLALQRWAKSGFTCGHPLESCILSFFGGIPCLGYVQQLEKVVEGKTFGAQCPIPRMHNGADAPFVYFFMSKPDSNKVYEIRAVKSPHKHAPNEVDLSQSHAVLDQVHWSTDISFRADGIEVQGVGPIKGTIEPSRDSPGPLTRKTVFVRVVRIWLIN